MVACAKHVKGWKENAVAEATAFSSRLQSQAALATVAMSTATARVSATHRHTAATTEVTTATGKAAAAYEAMPAVTEAAAYSDAEIRRDHRSTVVIARVSGAVRI